MYVRPLLFGVRFYLLVYVYDFSCFSVSINSIYRYTL